MTGRRAPGAGVLSPEIRTWQAPIDFELAGRHLLFVDSSGNPHRKSGIDAYYTVGCLTGSASALNSLFDMLYALKLGLVPGRDPESWEVHSVRITHGRKYYPLRPRTEKRRLDTFGAFVRVICRSDVTLFGIAIDNEKLYGRFGPNVDVIDKAWTFLLERFELFMRDQKTENSGFVIADRTGGADMQHIHTLVDSTTRRRNPMADVRTSRVEGIEFVESSASPMLQVADVIAYIISRYINGDARFRPMAERLLEKMWVSDDNVWRGWKVQG